MCIRDRTITGQYYASLLDRLNEEIKKKTTTFDEKKVLLYQDNAPAHSSVIVTVKLFELRYEIPVSYTHLRLQ